jgi:hypothetical protein
MKFAISYNTAYHGVDPDRIVAYARQFGLLDHA